jgi:hypothetical protein
MGLGSEIWDPEKTYSGSRGQKGTGSRIRICNTAVAKSGPNLDSDPDTDKDIL